MVLEKKQFNFSELSKYHCDFIKSMNNMIYYTLLTQIDNDIYNQIHLNVDERIRELKKENFNQIIK
jgi:hypothetical protein